MFRRTNDMHTTDSGTDVCPVCHVHVFPWTVIPFLDSAAHHHSPPEDALDRAIAASRVAWRAWETVIGQYEASIADPRSTLDERDALWARVRDAHVAVDAAQAEVRRVTGEDGGAS